MSSADKSAAREMIDFIDRSPSPYHACSTAADMLVAAGFQRLDETAQWSADPGGAFIQRGGSLVAWHVPAQQAAGFRVIGAHTDSPNLRVKPHPDHTQAGLRQLGVEVYGGVLLNSWLDRDLGLSGRVFVKAADGGAEERLLLVNRPLLRVPQLAIHLNRDIRTDGLLLNPQTHMAPVWSLSTTGDSFREFLADELDAGAEDILSWDVMCHDVNPSTVFGQEDEFVSAPRLDNLCSCFTALRALVDHSQAGGAGEHVALISLFDHEEVGSRSRAGASSPILRDILERIVLTQGGGREDYHRAIAQSVCVSADMAHATHPNYAERHEPDHHLHINAGPVIKLNVNQSYASEGETEAIFQLACEAADVPYQKWVNRTDLACGSTIGPITAARLGMRTVDVGNPQLAMHSVREMCGSDDPGYMIAALTRFLG